MNIFVLDSSPKLAAQYNCDIHCSKIFLEITQMLAYCFPLEALKFAPKTQVGKVRTHSKTHFNHPVSKFVRGSLGNLLWTMDHAYYLDEERIWRSEGTKAPHFSKTFLDWCVDNIKDCLVPDKEMTEFAVAINENSECCKNPEFKDANVVNKYRLYYKLDKTFATWTRRPKPEWYETAPT